MSENTASPLSEGHIEFVRNLLEKDANLRAILTGPLEVEVVTITPEIGRLMLLTSPGNRNYSDNNLNKIKDDMAVGRFYPGNDAIMIDLNNCLRNGHHRILMIIVTGIPQKLIIRRRVPEYELSVIDQPFKRSSKQALDLQQDFVEKYGSKLNRNEGSIVLNILKEGNKKNISLGAQPLADATLYFKDSFSFIFGIIGRQNVKGVCHSANLAPLVRMHKSGVPHDKIAYAVQYLLDGGLEVERGNLARMPGTDTLQVLRDWLLKLKYSSSTEAIQAIYYTSEMMLKCFIDGIDRAKPSMAKHELFPLPLESLPWYPKNCDVTRHMKRIGIEMMQRLSIWLDNQANATVYQLKDLLAYTPNNLSEKTIANKIRRLAKEDGYIRIPRVGRLVPIIDPGKKKIEFYELDKDAR